MKKFQFPAAALLLLATTAFTSCSNDDDDAKNTTEQRTAYVTIVDGEETATVNELVKLDVTYVVDNLCASFVKFQETPQANGVDVSVIAAYDDKVCAPAQAAKTAKYNFKATAPGTYVLKFKTNTTDYVTHTVVVQ